jgi:hypothetical protein
MPGNDVAQVHRYLDLGASLEICHGPVDVLAADAVRELAQFKPDKPVILAESGAVEPGHAGPFKLYAKDKDGILLHDVLFAPFFSGAAGAGQIWHWDSYVDKNDLWRHFARFAAAVKDIDPPAEQFQPSQIPHPRLRVYALPGKRTILLWCRDSQNDWRTELEQGKAPDSCDGVKLDLAALFGTAKPASATFYDPWKDQWSETKLKGASVALPSFARSLVVRVALKY